MSYVFILVIATSIITQTHLVVALEELGSSIMFIRSKHTEAGKHTSMTLFLGVKNQVSEIPPSSLLQRTTTTTTEELVVVVLTSSSCSCSSTN